MLTHVLHYSFAYEVTRLVAPHEGRINSTGGNTTYRIGVATSGVNLAGSRAVCVAAFGDFST